MLAGDYGASIIGTDRIPVFFLLVPAFFTALSTGGISSIKSSHEGIRTNRHLWLHVLGDIAVNQSAGVLFVFWFQKGGFRFWWVTPSLAAIPVPAVRLFEIGTTVFWFASPLLAYWLAVSVRRLWKKRHKLPPESPSPEGSHSR